MKNTFIIFLFTVITGLIIWDIFFRKHPEPKPFIDYRYATDTVYLPSPYAVPEPYAVPTPPRIITYYEVDSSVIDSLNLLLSEKDILIAGLLDTIRISESYLKQYPNNPKLLAIDLQRDTMSMGTLNITGIPQEDKWPIDLSQFDYRWTFAAGLSRHPVHSPPTKERPTLEYLVGGGVDFLYLSPYMGGRVEMNWTRIRPYVDIRVGLLKIESSEIKLGVDYKLNGNRN